MPRSTCQHSRCRAVDSRPRARSGPRGAAHRTRSRLGSDYGSPRALEGTEPKLLTLAGAFAAIAALFGGPLVATFILLELCRRKWGCPAR